MHQPSIAIREALIGEPRTYARSVIAGLRSKIVGRVRPGKDSIRSPFFHRSCVAYQLEVFSCTSKGESRIAGERTGTPFWIDDDTGSAFVQTRLPDLHLVTMRSWERSNAITLDGDAEWPTDEEMAALSAVLGRNNASHHIFEDYRLRIAEYTLEPNVQVAASGVVAPYNVEPEESRKHQASDPFRHHPSHHRRLSIGLVPGRSSAVRLSDDPDTFG